MDKTKNIVDFYAAISPQYWKKATQGKYLISAGSWWKGQKERPFYEVPEEDMHEQKFMPIEQDNGKEIVVDCGAWKFSSIVSEEGYYPYRLTDYFSWAFSFNPKWVAIPDVIGDKDKTIELFRQAVEEVRKEDYIWRKQNYKKLVPVVQGKTVEEYLECAEVYKAGGFEFVAVGGIKGNDWVVKTIPPLLHKMGLKMHLFGAGISELESCHRLDGVVSCDSGNWSGRFGNVLDEYKAIQKMTGMTQAEVAINRFLPEYRQRIQDISWMKKAQLELEGVL